LRAHQFLQMVTVTAFLLIICPIRAAAQGARQRQGPAIEVRLIPKKKSIRVGDQLEVRVEIWNVSRQTFFIEKAIHELCGPSSPLSLRLELGPPKKPQVGQGCASDCLWRAEDGFARRLVMGWTSLPGGNFYGTVISMSPGEFPQLKTPGRWRLQVSYESAGDLSAEVSCLNAAPIPNNKELIDNLPYEAWHGHLDTNTVWIEVLPRTDSPTDKKSH
jgi:hypothetical protein